ncbi:hypothetical protein [Brevibacterium sp. CFH 10365]|uniref:hypothetical protein n=1 Tax=Brevibacterium sp. CFH 10365 TaxID=2585207 RepID=UPI0012662A64|nr:hypothetical protein [Brevibacterium sp. CFH 10365]
MSTDAFDHTSRLESALNRRGNPMSVDAFMDILREMSEPASEPLSTGERAFLFEATDLSEEDLTPQAHEAARIQVDEDRALAEKEARDSALTTGEVSDLLGRQGASILRSMLAGDLCVLPASNGRTTLFPAWQFEGNQVVPGLRRIIPNFPQYVHPLTIQQFMIEEREELDGRSAVEWLMAGGAVEAVVSLVAELGYE